MSIKVEQFKSLIKIEEPNNGVKLLQIGGASGLSAYQLAVRYDGFTGTLAEYQDSLKGEKGDDAYEVAVSEGFVGTKAEWLDSLNGTDGYTPVKGVDYFDATDITQAEKDNVYNTYLANFYNPSVIALHSRAVNESATFGVKLHSVQTTLGNDTPKFSFIPSVYKAGKAYSVLPSDGTGDFTVDRNSTARYIDKNGVLQIAAANEPRIDWSSGKPALLVEPQRTNLDSNSITLSNWVSIGTVTKTLNYTIAPDGTTTANRLEIAAASRFENLYVLYDNTEYTFSIYVKTVTGSSDFSIYAKAKNNTFVAITTTTVNDSEYTRCEVIFNSLSGGTTPGISFRTTGDFIVWNAQLEEGSTATSDIKTEGATKTRLKDTITATPPSGVTSITETKDGVEQPPITTIPTTYTVPEGRFNKIIMD